MAGRGGSGLGSAIRRFVSGTALLALGTSLGIVIGTVWNVPELIARRLLGPVQRVELSARRSEPRPLPARQDLETEPVVRRATRPEPRGAPPPPVAAAPPRSEAPTAKLTPTARPAPVPSARAPAAPPPGLQPPPADGRGRRGVVQVASYTDRRAADALAQRLQAGGYRSVVSPTPSGSELRYRVRVMPDERRDEAALASELRKSGYSVWIARE